MVLLREFCSKVHPQVCSTNSPRRLTRQSESSRNPPAISVPSRLALKRHQGIVAIIATPLNILICVTFFPCIFLDRTGLNPTSPMALGKYCLLFFFVLLLLRRRLLNRSLFSHRPRVVFRSFRSRKNKNHHLQILDCSSPTVDSKSRRGGSCLCLYLCLYLLLLCRRLHLMMMRWDCF